MIVTPQKVRDVDLKMTAPPSALRMSLTSARELPDGARNTPTAQSTASRDISDRV